MDEVLLVLDATTGQNGLQQARVFAEVVDVTGIVLTKLDGTAKGGIVVAVQRALGVPVKLVGLGEGPDDLAPFDPEASSTPSSTDARPTLRRAHAFTRVRPRTWRRHGRARGFRRLRLGALGAALPARLPADTAEAAAEDLLQTAMEKTFARWPKVTRMDSPERTSARSW